MMELKNYQKRVLGDLRLFVARGVNKSPKEAYADLWLERNGLNVHDPLFEFPQYQEKQGLPFTACLKVPTGGGKTFIACNALKVIMDQFQTSQYKAVVWLVPSDTILKQTFKALSNGMHSYRQRIDRDFQGKVSVYGKEELLQGSGFNLTIVEDQLTIMVLSYDSFRTKTGERLAMRENSSLVSFTAIDGGTEIKGADETSLFAAINRLNPVVIVDESHHATSKLSLDMLKNFNPRFVLELTATPRESSNVISYVDAFELKMAKMVKLPVVLYNMKTHEDVLATAIGLRSRLEELGKRGKQYLRPIVLVQAQPRIGKDAITFKKVKQQLIDIGIPEKQIAIKTADIDELSNVDLMSPNCEIRFIITVNALKEGWDCPFAYILASLANKSSTVDVEQILGRVLRLPYTREQDHQANNLAYVLTASTDFDATIRSVIAGLNSAGFSPKDDREKEEILKVNPTSATLSPSPVVPVTKPSKPSDDDVPNIDTSWVKDSVEKAATEKTVTDMVEQAVNLSNRMTKQPGRQPGLPPSVVEKSKRYYIQKEHRDEIERLTLPMFGIAQELGSNDLFKSEDEEEYRVLEQSDLLEGFTLKDKSTNLDIDKARNIVEIDIRERGEDLKSRTLYGRDAEKIEQLLTSTLPIEKRRKNCKQIVLGKLDKFDSIKSSEISSYVDRVISGLDAMQLETLIDAPEQFAVLLKAKINEEMEKHKRAKFEEMLTTGEIRMVPTFKFPEFYDGINWDLHLDNTLYEGVETGNGLEQKLATRLSGMPGIKWWHRNINRRGFRINGPISDHFPDFIVRTKKGTTVLIETKGEYLKGTDNTEYKVDLGNKWASTAGRKYRYYMVYESMSEMGSLKGVISLTKLTEILQKLG